MKATTYGNLNHLSIPLRSLQEIQDALQSAKFGVHKGRRYFQIGNTQVPVSQIVDAILIHRPSLWGDEEQLKPYFDVIDRFKELLEPTQTSVLEKISNCFRKCLFPSACCVCNPKCKEQLLLADAGMGLKGTRRYIEIVTTDW